MRALLAAALFALAGAVAAQSPAPQPPATPALQPPERKASGEPRLNLNLDDASRRQILRDLPSERGAGSAASSLPSLGATPGSRSGSFGDLPGKTPYPANTNPNTY